MKTTEPNTIIDLSYIRLLANGDEPFEAEILLSLRTELTQKMEAMQHELHSGRREGVRLCAHALKNLFDVLGSYQLRDAFLLMETESRTVNNELLNIQFADCSQMWLRVQQEIAALLAAFHHKADAA